MVKYSVVAIWLQKLLEKKLRRMSGIPHIHFFLPEWMSRDAENENAEETGACRDYDDFFSLTRYTVPEGVLLAFLCLCLPWLHDHTRQICSCAHIYACAKLPSGEEMLLADLLFAKIHRNLR